jgi:hypothetical protein
MVPDDMDHIIESWPNGFYKWLFIDEDGAFFLSLLNDSSIYIKQLHWLFKLWHR